MANKYRNEILELKSLDDYSFENIFTMHKDGDFHFYNLLRTINFPKDIESSLYVMYRVKARQPLGTLSFNVYNTNKLWWLILLVNQINNPMEFVEPGTQLKVIKPEMVSEIIKLIKTQLI